MNARNLMHVEGILGFKDGMISALESVPGISDVTVFGSCADGSCDEFSDLDIRATTIDIELTRPQLYHALSRTDTIELEWPIEEAPGNWAATFVFMHLSPLRRLDLNIGSTSEEQPGHDPKRSGTFSGPADRTGQASSAYRPNIGSIEHYTISHLLGTTRYAKARRRGQLLSCWRFASALVDAVIATGYSGIAETGWMLAGLTTHEYRDADLRLDPSRRSALIGEMDFSNPNAMDRTVVLLAGRLIANYRMLESPVPIPDRLLRRLSDCTAHLLEQSQPRR
ncbi:MAG TPA: hypothetical protein VGR08_04635 [Thermomicrobiales bacterium]|nr:hypothetical protein [Thermomicrobiales bacterium]